MTSTSGLCAGRADHRRRSLDPWLARLRERCHALSGDDPGGAEELVVPIGDDRVTFSAIEAAHIRRAFTPDGTSDPASQSDSDRLHAEVAAYLVKSAHVAQRLAAVAHGEATPYGLQAEQIVGLALGQSLLEETRTQIDLWIQQGRNDEARVLSALRSRLWHAVAEARASIDPVVTAVDLALDGRREGDEEPEWSVPASPQASRTDAHRPAVASKKRARFTFHVRDEVDEILEVPRGRSRLAVAVLLAVAIWIVLDLARGEPRPAVLTVEDFSTELGVVGVLARHPSLFVEVDGEAWRDLGEAAQARVVERISEVVEEHGYKGVLVRDGDQRVLARWWHGVGARPIASTDPGTPAGNADPERSTDGNVTATVAGRQATGTK